jgi:hypothetical protein
MTATTRTSPPKVRMGSGEAPAKLLKHVSTAGTEQDDAAAKPIKRTPKVHMGEGMAPTTLLKHVAPASRK